MTRTRLALTSLALFLLPTAAGCGAAAPQASAPRASAAEESGAASGDRYGVSLKDSPPAPPPGAYPSPAASMAPADEAKGEATTAGAPPAAPRAAAKAAEGMARPASGGKIAADEPSPVMAQPTAAVKAGEWDDNANYREFQKWVRTEQGQPFHRADVTDRQFIVVRDADGKALPRCPVVVADEQSKKITLTTTASGRALFFPHAEGLAGQNFTASTSCQNGAGSARFSLSQSDGVVDLKLAVKRVLPPTRDVDIAFVLDTTGSMSEEIAAVKATIQKVASSFNSQTVRIRIGMVEFKDRSDSFVTKVYPMTTDVVQFSRQVAAISAAGGGDIPESVNEGLHVGLTGLSWSGAAVAKMAFLIGDAPPHLDYPQDYDYAADMKDAAHKGIQVFTVAASGMDDLGQVVWRQIAQYTGATNLFVLRGGAGAQSTGAGDPKSSCGGTQTAFLSGNLDALIVQKVSRELKGLDRDPLKIAGLRVDESAKPCNERLMIAE